MTEATEKKVELLQELSETERKLLSAILKIELDNLHLTKPHVVNDMIAAVRDHIK